MGDVKSENIYLPNGSTVEVSNSQQVSDGYHTFGELYQHRCLLFIALMKHAPQISWRANNHSDGSSLPGWFIAGMHLPTGDISYHLPDSMWELLDYVGIATGNRAPKWDGHSSFQVINRLKNWVSILRSKPKNDSLWAIWSVEHGAWWRDGRSGYTTVLGESGLYAYEEAVEIVNNARVGADGRPNECMVPAESFRNFSQSNGGGN